MLNRYATSEAKHIWSEENFFSLCLDIEIACAEAMAKQGLVPDSALAEIKQKARFDMQRIEEIESVTHHQFIAFLSCVMENIGEDGRYLHKGMTSSDVLDTAFALQMKQVGLLIKADIENVCRTLQGLAVKYKNTLMIGRTHGMHAEPTTFGLVLLGFYTEWQRNLDRINNAIEEVSVAMISGAVGNFANVGEEVEAFVANSFGQRVEEVSTQVLPRDRFAMFFATLAVIASSMERLATEIRHLQRTEVAEAKENFGKGQKGSSAMPHKSNPILSENLCGLARVIRATVIPALEDVSLWHERDMSHSSAERFIAPDATVTLDFALKRLDSILQGLQVNEKKMLANINLQNGLVFSQRVLLALVDKGVNRDIAYKYVQSCAVKVWDTGSDFRQEIEKSSDIMQILTPADLDGLFDLQYYTRGVDGIFARVL